MSSNIINPRILIQHYYEYPYQVLSNVREEFQKYLGSYDEKTFNPENCSYLDKAYSSTLNGPDLTNYLRSNPAVWNTNAHSLANKSFNEWNASQSEPNKLPLTSLSLQGWKEGIQKGDLNLGQWKDTYLKELRPQNFPTTTSLDYSKIRAQADPQFLLEFDKEVGSLSEGELTTDSVLYRLFADEAVRYFERPQMKYINKLFNDFNFDTDDPADYNENYTLSQIWLAVVKDTDIEENEEDGSITFNSKLQNEFEDNETSQFVKIDVPKLVVGNNTIHDPSKVYFTNDPNNINLVSNDDGWTFSKEEEGIRWSKKTNSQGEVTGVTILVTDGLIIRLVFSPTSGTWTNDEVDFFDYDISNGWIYPSEQAAQKAKVSGNESLHLAVFDDKGGLYLVEKDEQGNYIKSDDGSYRLGTNIPCQFNTRDQSFPSQEDPNKNISIPFSTLEILDDSQNITINNLYFPTSTQSQLEEAHPNLVWYAFTQKQGINSNISNSDTQNAIYAFGNNNAFTGLGLQEWSYPPNEWSPEPEEENSSRIALLNKLNESNDYFSKEGMSPNYGGATFNLPSGLNENTIDWNSRVTAPNIFDLNTSDTGVTVYSKAKNTPEYFSLKFNREGGTYVLEDVLKTNSSSKNSSVLSGLSKIKKVYDHKASWMTAPKKIYSNSFWPMDYASSYGTNGHDLKFGSRKGVAFSVENSELPLSRGVGEGDGQLPWSDDGLNHNSYFGMKLQIPFTLENGYAAPLNYFFYGDDDMFVFLSKCTRDPQSGKVISIDPDSTVLVSDLGGVHSSIGMYVNLWDFISPLEKEEIEKRTSDQTINGVEEIIYQYQANTSNETAENYEASSVPNKTSQDFVLSVFYTERGASGSSCYLRFSVPFKGLNLAPRAQDGELKIGKEVVNSISLLEGQETPNEEKYIFELDLQNDDGSSFFNRYPIVIHDSEHKSDLENSIINSNPSSIEPDDQLKNLSFRAITDTGRFTLTSGQHAYIYGLPHGSSFEVKEVGKYPKDSTSTNLYEACIPLNDTTSTTFRTGTFTTNSSNPNWLNEVWNTGFAQGTSFKDDIQEQNKVEFVNSPEPGILRIEKNLSIPSSFKEQFQFHLKLTIPNENPITQVPWLKSSSGSENKDKVLALNQELEFTNQKPLVANDNNIFDFDLAPTEVAIFYGLPLGTTFEITEDDLPDPNNEGSKYTVDHIQVNGQTVHNQTSENKNEIIGQIISPSNDKPSVTVSYFNSRTNIELAKLRVSKELISSDINAPLDQDDKNQKFTFQIELTPLDGNSLEINTLPYQDLTHSDSSPSEISLSDGKGTFSLIKDQTIEISELPLDVTYAVQELDEAKKPIEEGDWVNQTYLLSQIHKDTFNTVPRITFTNLKVQSNPKIPSGLKVLSGDRKLKEDEFSFTLTEIPNTNDDGDEEEEENDPDNLTSKDSSDEENTNDSENPILNDGNDKEQSFDSEDPNSSQNPTGLDGEENNNNTNSNDGKDTSSSKDKDLTNNDNTDENNSDLEPKDENLNGSNEQEDNKDLTDLDNNPPLNDPLEEPVQSIEKLNDSEDQNNTIIPQNERDVSEEEIPNDLDEWGEALETSPLALATTGPTSKRFVSILSPFLFEESPLQEGDPDSSTSSNNGSNTPFRAQNDLDGFFSFPGLQFTQAGTYLYELKEDIPSLKEPTIEYSNTSYYVQIKVITQGKNLKIDSIQYFKDPGLTQQVPNNLALFVNRYIPPTLPEDPDTPNPPTPTPPTPTPPSGGGTVSKPSIALVKEQRKISEGITSDWNKFDSSNPMQVNEGDVIEYRLTVTNTSNTTAKNVVIKDTVPSPDQQGIQADLVLDPSSLQNATISGSTITWDIGNLGAKKSQSVTFKVNVPPVNANTTWTNGAMATFGPNPNHPTEVPSNKVTSEEKPKGSSKLLLIKEQRKIVNGVASEWNMQDRNNPMVVNGGDTVEYRLTVTVDGTTELHNVTIRDALPTFEGTPGHLVLDENSLSGVVNVDDGIIKWRLGTMQPNESQSVTFQVQVPETGGQTYWSNGGTVSHGNDPDHPDETIPSNIVTIVENPSSTGPKLTLIKEQRLIRNGVTYPWNRQGRNNPMIVQANDIVEYHLVVTNLTMDSVPNVVIKDTLPSPLGSNAQLVLITQGNAHLEGQTLIWNIGTLSPLEVVTLTFQVRIPSISSSTVWPNVGIATYGEDPKNPEGTIPSNEVDIKEDPKIPTNTTTISTTTSTNKTTTSSTTSHKTSTSSTVSSNTSSNNLRVPSKNESNAPTATSTSAVNWLIATLSSLVLLAFGLAFYLDKNKS